MFDVGDRVKVVNTAFNNNITGTIFRMKPNLLDKERRLFYEMKYDRAFTDIGYTEGRFPESELVLLTKDEIKIIDEKVKLFEESKKSNFTEKPLFRKLYDEEEYYCPIGLFVESSEIPDGVIKEVQEKDILSSHVKKWFMNMKDWQRSVSPKDFQPDFLTSNPEYGIFVYGYYIDENLDGFLRVDDYGDMAGITWFYINPSYQLKGIGQKLFQHVLDNFREKTLSLQVERNNKRAIHVYKKYGFTIIAQGTQPGASVKSIQYYVMERPSAYFE
jgi:ribosomal protein S18 acetylase RimI-like enzyme